MHSIVVSAVLIAGFTGILPPPERPSRSVEFSYQATIDDVPAEAKKVRIWVPIPKSDPFQKISNLQVKGPGEAKVADEPSSGNRMAYFETAPSAGKPISIQLTFTATRFENHVDLQKPASAADGTAEKKFLAPDRLGTIDDSVRKMTADATRGKTMPVEKARAIYDAVLGHMTYDKSGTGWGRGDTKHACEVGKGNCTDYHALFMSMSRAADIPTKFQIGFPLPTDAKAGKIGGYHCWALFFAPGMGWVPVDGSEADKNPDKAGYFFGSHDVNRIQFTEGRDLKLAPPQEGEPLNFFVYPYVEVDGKPHDKLTKTFGFKDVAAPSSQD